MVSWLRRDVIARELWANGEKSSPARKKAMRLIQLLEELPMSNVELRAHDDMAPLTKDGLSQLVAIARTYLRKNEAASILCGKSREGDSGTHYLYSLIGSADEAAVQMCSQERRALGQLRTVLKDCDMNISKHGEEAHAWFAGTRVHASRAFSSVMLAIQCFPEEIQKTAASNAAKPPPPALGQLQDADETVIYDGELS